MSAFLTDPELSEMTGLVQQAAIIRWLNENGFRGKYVTSARGKVRVWRAAMDEYFGTGKRTNKSRGDKEALLEVMNYGKKKTA